MFYGNEAQLCENNIELFEGFTKSHSPKPDNPALFIHVLCKLRDASRKILPPTDLYDDGTRIA
ncbi:hypothetical protein BPOR_0032g00100 [Botrytis porri]|uniref:Uncharacterized protein n=1 Tax=Botrytis porri TaxID=87229 RepID=A0A4Z1L3A9_9HELO|nr:hypothetical protein BPOR_0032g00100 [Botrytis porri]